jgi:hypothetical protein
VAECLLIFATLMTLGSCILRPITEKELIGKYQGTLPDGGMEILELKPDGVCDQSVALEDGRKFSTSGTWIYDKPQKNVVLKDIYITVDFMGKIDPDLGNLKGAVRIEPVKKSLSGKIIIGADEGETYEKMRLSPPTTGRAQTGDTPLFH